MYTEVLHYILVSFFLLFFVSKISYKLNLVDIPNKRKIHLKPTAYTGGFAISLAFFIFNPEIRFF
jgi:UDP-GlcNAc:undecaprenyl-phosphate GlcNAc-1-phosphate transferase